MYPQIKLSNSFLKFNKVKDILYVYTFAELQPNGPLSTTGHSTVLKF